MATEAEDDDTYRVPLPLETVVGETPLSTQANSQRKEDWKKLVRDAANAKIKETREQYFLDSRPLAVTIYYFPPSKQVPDVDNIIKPIFDAMKFVAYRDDSCIERIVAQKLEPDVLCIFPSLSPSLQVAIAMVKPAVYIRLEDSLIWREVS